MVLQTQDASKLTTKGEGNNTQKCKIAVKQLRENKINRSSPVPECYAMQRMVLQTQDASLKNEGGEERELQLMFTKRLEL